MALALILATGAGFHANDWQQIVFRLLLALFAGGTIGLNREIQDKSAGLRTHILVSTGAALFVMVPLQVMGPDFIDALSRAIQGVATGVGFVGAGTILHQTRGSRGKLHVSGLTTAATIWLTAALGVQAGCGFWQVCIAGSVLGLVVLSGLKRLERRIPLIDRDERG